jgi:hypothetical protein
MLAWELAWELAWKWAGICRERRTPAWISVPIAAEATRAPVVITTFEPAPRMPAGLQLPAPAQSELMAPVHADLLSVLSQELTSHSQPCPKRRPSPPGLASYGVIGSCARARRSLFDALIKPILQVIMHNGQKQVKNRHLRRKLSRWSLPFRNGEKKYGSPRQPPQWGVLSKSESEDAGSHVRETVDRRSAPICPASGLRSRVDLVRARPGNEGGWETPHFSIQFLCENRKSCYLFWVCEKGALRGAWPHGEGRGEDDSYLESR